MSSKSDRADATRAKQCKEERRERAGDWNACGMQRGREFWIRLVEQCAQSPLSRPAFAAQHGVSVGTLRWWIYRVRREPTPAPRILPIRLRAPGGPSAPQEEWGAGGAVEAQLPNGVQLRFANGTSSTYVIEVVGRLLERRC